MQQEVQSRNIKFLLHFTRLENLDSILNNGLAPRQALEQQAAEVNFNDPYRYDGYKNASCLSVGFPNYKMFYSLRQQFPDQEWVVLGFKADVLWHKDCAFCCENAASNNVRSIPIDERKGVEAFRKMFDPIDEKPSRIELKLLDSYPTNPQAEILVFDDIEPAFILGAFTQTKARAEALEQQYPGFKFLHAPKAFSYRKDYGSW